MEPRSSLSSPRAERLSFEEALCRPEFPALLARPRAAPAATETPMIRLRDLRKSFGSITAVDGVSLEIARGEAFGLLGPNGAGKTTTISMIVGLLAPDAGTVEVGGADPLRAGDAPAHRHLPAVGLALPGAHRPPEPRFLRAPAGTLGARPAHARRLGARLRRADRSRRRRGSTRTRAACSAGSTWPPAWSTTPRSCSATSRRWASIRSRATTSSSSIERLRDEGRTILYTTHYMEEAQRLCERVAIIDHGAVLALGSPDELIAEHGGAAR